MPRSSSSTSAFSATGSGTWKRLLAAARSVRGSSFIRASTQHAAGERSTPACSASRSTTRRRPSRPSNTPSAREISASDSVSLGTAKLSPIPDAAVTESRSGRCSSTPATPVFRRPAKIDPRIAVPTAPGPKDRRARAHPREQHQPDHHQGRAGDREGLVAKMRLRNSRRGRTGSGARVRRRRTRSAAPCWRGSGQ